MRDTREKGLDRIRIENYRYIFFFSSFSRVSDKRGIFVNEINLTVLSRWIEKKERKKKNWKKEGKWKINSYT